MRRLTGLDERRDSRRQQRVVELRAQAERAKTPRDHEFYERALQEAESLARWDRVYPAGLWIYSLVALGWLAPAAFLYRALGPAVSAAFLAVYAVVVGVVWVRMRVRKHRPAPMK